MIVALVFVLLALPAVAAVAVEYWLGPESTEAFYKRVMESNKRTIDSYSDELEKLVQLHFLLTIRWEFDHASEVVGRIERIKERLAAARRRRLEYELGVFDSKNVSSDIPLEYI